MLERFPIDADHPSRAAHEWLDEVLEPLCAAKDAGGAASKRALKEPPGFQVALLKACVERMPWYSQATAAKGYSSPEFTAGGLCYEIACALYRRRLPFSEADVCDLLRASKHGCGHGGDVKPPLEVALAHARAHGVTPELLGALRGFVEGLSGLLSVQARDAQRKGELILLLDEGGTRRRGPCWSDRFRAGLRGLPEDERAQWSRFVVHVNVNDVVEPPRHWLAFAREFVAGVGPERVLTRLAEWWPDPAVASLWPLQTAGSHLLKHFIWLFDALQGADARRSDSLVDAVTHLDWKPRERGAKVMIAAARALATRPAAVAGPGLERLVAWSALTQSVAGQSQRIERIAADFRARHGHAVGGAATGGGAEGPG